MRGVMCFRLNDCPAYFRGSSYRVMYLKFLQNEMLVAVLEDAPSETRLHIHFHDGAFPRLGVQ